MEAQSVMRQVALACAVTGFAGLASDWAACAARTAQAESRPEYNGNVVGSLLGEPATLDPVMARTEAEISLVGMLFDTLYKLQPDGTVAPGLALAMPEVDGNIASIQVRTVETHDGGSLGPADVAASLDRLRTSAAGWILAGVGGVSAADDRVVLTLTHAVPELATRLAMPQASITPGGKPVGTNGLVGTGPFSLVQFDRKKHKVVLKAFVRHHAGRPYVDQLDLSWFTAPDAEVRRFETGGAHVSLRGATTFTDHQPKYKKADVDGPDSLLVYVGFGKAHPTIAANKDFRRALSLAIGREGFTTIGTGERVTPAGGPLPVDYGGVAATLAQRDGDLDAAKAALASAQAKVTELADGKLGDLSLEILVDDTRPDDHEIGERVVVALRKLGIKATLSDVTAVDLADRAAAGTCDMYIGQLAAASTDPALLWAAAFEAGGDGWARAQLAAGALDVKVAAKEFAARLPFVPLFHRSIRATHRTDLRNVGIDASGRLGFADAFFFGKPEK
jgi:ABC-type transport system substrate-binding protein